MGLQMLFTDEAIGKVLVQLESSKGSNRDFVTYTIIYELQDNIDCRPKTLSTCRRLFYTIYALQMTS